MEAWLSSLVLLLVAVDRSPIKDPRREIHKAEHPVHSFSHLSQLPAQGSEAMDLDHGELVLEKQAKPLILQLGI